MPVSFRHLPVRDVTDATQNFEQLMGLLNGLIPIGTILGYGGAVAPENFLLCEGQAVGRAKYSALFAVLGVASGAGDGSTTFNLPDGRGKVMIGVSALHVLGAIGGEETHVLSEAEMPSHAHSAAAPYTTAAGGVTSGTGIPPHNGVPSGSNWGISTGAAGGGGAHNNMQPFFTGNWIIRAL